MVAAGRSLEGSCNCRSISFVVSGPARDVYNCHCERCRKFTGHHMAATAADPEMVHITDSDRALSWYSPAPRIYYGFCSHCGSSLFWRSDDHPERVSICAGTLDVPTGLRTTKAWWLADVSDYFARDPGVQEYDHEG